MKAMQHVIEGILRQHGLAQVFLQASGACLRLENLPHSPLVIESTGHSGAITVAHEVIYNETPVGDPVMAFRLGDWMPLRIEYGVIGECREVFSRVEGVEQRADALLAELEAFAGKWAADLEAQGFTDLERVRASSATHPYLVERATEQRAGQLRARSFAPDSHLEMSYENRTDPGDV